MPERDAALSQIVGGEFEGDAVAGQNANAITTKAPGQVSQHNAVLFQLNAEQTAGKLFKNGTGDFDAIFFAQTFILILFWQKRRGILLVAPPAAEKQDLRRGNVRRLQSLRTIEDLELHARTFV